MIFLDEDVDLEVLVILGITGRDLFRQLAFGVARGLNLALDERHADHSVTFDAHRLARELRPVVNTNVEHVTRADTIAIVL